MASWDVFHADRLELERGLDESSIRAALARGELRDDDLVRPAGTAVRWARIADLPELTSAPAAAPPPPQPAPTPPPTIGKGGPDFEEVRPLIEEIAPPATPRQPTELPGPTSSSDVAIPVLDEAIRSQPPRALGPAPALPAWSWDEEDEDEEDEDDEDEGQDPGDLDDIEILADDEPEAEVVPPRPALPVAPAPRGDASDPRRDWEPGEHDLELDERPDSRSSHVALPVVRSRDRDDAVVPDGADDPEASFSLARSATTTVEELDLAPMVDVAFNLVLFFMVTASTILYKTLEIPKPSAEAPAGAVAQGRSRSLDDLKDDYILVEIDDRGEMKLDREPIEPTMTNLVELLRRSREKTGRKAMLLSADFATPHRNAVLAYDAANEIGMGIAIARPQAPMGPAPTLRPAQPPQPGPNRPS